MVSPFLLVCWTVAWVVAGFSPGFLATVSGELGNAALTSPLLAQADATPNAAVPDAAGDAVQDTIGSAESSGRIPGLNIEYSVVIGIIAAIVLCILPFFIGDRISKILRQPHLSTRIGWILFALTVPIATIAVFPFKLGVDLKGGTILTYGVQAITGGDADSRISAKAMAEPVKRRIDPSGVKEYVVRPYGDSQLEIIVPEVNQMEVERIKATLRQAGILQFAIVANNRDHEALRQRVMTEDPPNPQREIRDGDVIIGKWSRLGRDKQEDTKTGLYPVRFNPLDVPGAVVRDAKTARILNPPFNLSDELAFSGWMRDNGIADVEVLMNITPDLDVRGEDLASATTTRDQSGNPAIGFRLKDSASGKFFALTQENRPESDGFQRNLAIMMDNELLSAPQINSPIQGDGIIQGRFTRDEVESMVNILKSGRLPGALTEEPIAENTIDATLGKDTIRKGTIAIGVSLVIVLVFILVYYRFSGMVACLALGLNLLMTLGTMIWISQPLSLPGLAGLVLTVGMSVDANVLIFERIREELAKGAANRMAIRNGFDKATRTIVDANVTTLITALVLYGFGTDQIRGFAVTLILGIIFSMITAIYFAKTIFDLAERSKSLSLGMSNAMGTVGSGMTGKGEFDFMSRGTLSLAASAILIILGIASVFVRGGDILDIDLAGGSKVTAEVRGDDVTQSKIAAIVDKSIGTDAEGREVTNTVNGVDIRNPETGEFTKAWAITSGLKDANTMRKRLAEGFAAEPSVSLQTYVMDYTIVSNDLGLMRGDAAVRLVAYQDETEETSTEAQPPADAGSESADAGSAPVNGETADAGDSAAAADAGDSAAAADAGDSAAAADAGDSAAMDESNASETESDADAAGTADTASSSQRTKANLTFQSSEGKSVKINAPRLKQQLADASSQVGIPVSPDAIVLQPMGDDTDSIKAWTGDTSLVPFDQWQVTMPLNQQQSDTLMKSIAASMAETPVWQSSSNIGPQIASKMMRKGLLALLLSLVGVVLYIWFRFNKLMYGFAAVAALIHDVLITLGAIAVSFWLSKALGFLLVDEFKISLTVIAAFLTIVGYSLNDTIVVFDRIRETKGKSPNLTAPMINQSINQTLSRTLLTSLTTLMVVVLLYFFGGEGIHAFAFSLVIGVLVGTYSSIFVASPILLMLVNRFDQPAASEGKRGK